MAALTALAPVLGQLGPAPEQIATPEIQWFGISPMLVLVGGAVLLLTLHALIRQRPPAGVYAMFTVGTAALTLYCTALLWGRVTDEARGPFNAIADAVVVDAFSLYFAVVISVAIILASLLADGYLRREGLEGPELYVLMMLCGSGALTMAWANDLIVLFLGIEILSIALYVMAGSHRRRVESTESALKYFVLGSFSSAFLLYGIAFVYGATGSTNFSSIGTFLAGNVLENSGLLLAGLALMLVGLGFKVAAVPFHSWTPDVYQGAPSPVTGFMASAAKAAGFAALLRVLFLVFGDYRVDWQPLVWVLAVLTLVVATVMAIVQDDVKRTLAYTSIGHAGYILIGVHAASDRGVAGALFYLLSYTFIVLGIFTVVTLVGRRGDARHSLEEYRGLARSNPLLAGALTVFLLASAGVPLTAGFLAKFYVIVAAVEAESYALAAIGMLVAAATAFVYLRVVVTMYVGDGDDEAPAGARIAMPVGAGITLAVALIFTVGVGIVPAPVMDFARDAVPALLATG
jgi:NADH-quinone oxidoreductase subunit N